MESTDGDNVTKKYHGLKYKIEGFHGDLQIWTC
jgi:hypothetical protein